MGFSLGSLSKSLTSPSALGAFGSVALGGDASSAYSSYMNYQGVQDTNEMNKRIAESNNATAINLASTAHQREVADLKKAGLNPVLSAGGSGSSTPSLSTPTMQAPRMDYTTGSARERSMLDNQIDNLSQDKRNKVAQEALTASQTANEVLKSRMLSTSAKKTEVELDLLNKSLPNTDLQRDLDRKNLEFDQMMQPYDRVINKATEYLGGVGSAAMQLMNPLNAIKHFKAPLKTVPPPKGWSPKNKKHKAMLKEIFE